MRPSSNPSEVWVELHYRYKGESYKFNLPLPHGGKFLDGIRVDFNRREVPGGHRLTVSMETLGLVDVQSFVLTGELDYGDNLKGVFVNGYQSWTGSWERSPGERISTLNWPGRFLALQRLGDTQFFSYSERKGRFHGYAYGYVRYTDRLFLVGSLDESAGYTVIATDIRHNLFAINKDLSGFRLDDKKEVLDMVLLEGPESFVFDRYAAMRMDKPVTACRALAWISPAGGKKRVDEISIRRRLAAFRDRAVPLDYFVVGSGWHSALGDWNGLAPGFPSGMASLAAEIRGSGYSPGLWMAPFVAGVDSAVFRTRREWLAKEQGRAPRPAGRLPYHGGAFFALDLSRPEVKKYVAESYERLRDRWGYDFFILDLLYVAALFPPPGHSRGGAMDAAVDFLTSLKKNETWLFNAIPIESAFGRTEYCRIGADTTPYWENLYHRNIHARERASTVNALRSTIGRRQLDRRFFVNAVDSFFLRGAKGTMEPSRRYTQLLIHLLFGGFLSTSDDIARYAADEMRLFSSLFPMVDPEIESVSEFRRTITVGYTAAGRRFMSISNLAEQMRSFTLPEGRWFGIPGLRRRRRAHHIRGGRRQYLKPGESRNYFRLDDGDPFAGSDGHFFPGCEIDTLARIGGEWTVTSKAGSLKTFRIWLRAPEDAEISINGRAAEMVRTAAGDLLATGVVGNPDDL